MSLSPFTELSALGAPECASIELADSTDHSEFWERGLIEWSSGGVEKEPATAASSATAASLKKFSMGCSMGSSGS